MHEIFHDHVKSFCAYRIIKISEEMLELRNEATSRRH